MLDISKYQSTLEGIIHDNPSELGNIDQLTGKYILKSEESKLEVLFKIRNNTLTWCLVDVLEGFPHLTRSSSTELTGNANEFLSRYQIFTGDSGIEDYKSLLNHIDLTKNETKTNENLKCITLINPLTSTIEWRQTINGADYSGLSISFKENVFHAFKDDRSYYSIGSAEINISEDQAINIALEQTNSISWKIGTEEVNNFDVVEERINTKLLTRSRDVLNLYPYWALILPLDDIYPGLVYAIQVTIWADTAELIDINALSYGGPISVENIEVNKNFDQEIQLDLFLLTSIVVIFVSILSTGILIFKKRVRPSSSSLTSFFHLFNQKEL